MRIVITKFPKIETGKENNRHYHSIVMSIWYEIELWDVIYVKQTNQV